MKLAIIALAALALTGCASLLTHFWAKSMHCFSGVAIGGIRQFFGFKTTKTFRNSPARNLRCPKTTSTIPVNAPEAGFTVFTYSHVLFVLLVSCFSKVLKSVVRTNPVNMVNLVRWPISSYVKPSKPVGGVQPVIDSNLDVIRTANVAHVSSFHACGNSKGCRSLPCKNSNLWVVVENFAQMLCGKIGLSHDTVPSLIGQRPGSVISTSRLRYFTIGLLPVAMLSGCSSTSEYAQYSKAQVDIATAKSTADTARYQALASIAKDGADSARVAAVMALALGSSAQTPAAQIAAPQRSDALMWASILVPGITQAYAIGKSADVAINSSNNAMLTSTATTAGFVGIASQIQAPGAITTTTDRHDSIVTTPTPVVVPDIVQITPVVVPDTVVITPIAQPVTP